MKDLTQIVAQIHFYNNPKSRFNRFCRYCDHLLGECIDNYYCTFFGERCHDAVRKSCPLPTAGVAMLMESETVMSSHIQARTENEKGGTVVPPSDFQSVSTNSPETQGLTEKTTRPRGLAPALPRKEPLAPNQKSGKVCGERGCVYFGRKADYCQICSSNENGIDGICKEMCANLLLNICDGHACKCERYVDFIEWCHKRASKK